VRPKPISDYAYHPVVLQFRLMQSDALVMSQDMQAMYCMLFHAF